jgi:simple sugar transport system permease protein
MKDLLKKNGTRSVLATIISILIGLVAGSILVLIVGITSSDIGIKGAWEGIRLIVAGILNTGRDGAGNLSFGFNPQVLGNMLFNAVPLILCGLSVALAYKTGLFNIGASGQFLAGTCATLFVALSIPHGVLPQWLIWILAFLAGILAGALWGAIPGLLKAYLNINEVLACIMTNWIAANLVTWVFDVSNLKNMVEGTKTGYIYKTTYGLVNAGGDWVYRDGAGVWTPKLGLDKVFPGSQVNAGILIAIIIAVVVYIVLTKTTFGYELKACGSNRHAARYAGIKDKRSIVLSMALAGALAGSAASLYYLSGNTELYWSVYQKLPAEGFNGIAVAMLASCNPIACIFTGLFMAAVKQHGVQLSNLTAYNEYITDVIIAVIVYLSAFSLLIKTWISGARKKAPKAGTLLTYGILGLSFGLTFFLSFVGIILSAVGLSKAKTFVKDGNEMTKKARIGKILSIVGLVVSIVETVLFIVWAILVLVVFNKLGGA